MYQNCFILFIIVLLGYIFVQYNRPLDNFESVNDVSKPKVLSRRRRYVGFPEGSSFSAATCITVGSLGQPAPATNPGTFVWALNLAIAYELPNITETAGYYHIAKHRIHTHMMQRKHRRELYGKLETIIDNMGYRGRECILKTLCETSHRLTPGGENMIAEMFRTLFTMPQSRVLQSEPLEHTIYDAAHRLSSVIDNCSKFNCPISLVDLMKGKYDAPSTNVDEGNPWTFFSNNL